MEMQLTAPKNVGGRPSIYTEELASTILRRISLGETLRTICKDEGMPDRGTVRNWMTNDHEGFFNRYIQARHSQAEEWADGIREKAENATSENYKVVELQVKTDQWLMARNHPRFTDKIQQEHSGSVKYEVVTGVPEPEKASGENNRGLDEF